MIYGKNFQMRLHTEWRRLNPSFVNADATLWQSFKGGCIEGFWGFFAPARLLWWLLIAGWREGK